MVVSAPATFAICKLMVPEARSEDCEVLHGDCNNLCDDEKKKYSSILDAAQSGALAMLRVTANIAVVAYVFMTLIAWVNHTFGWFGDRVGVGELSIEVSEGPKMVFV
ncbi:sodium/nucleoside cotransporter [Elysia marginata]|uniref:Sodium/nucleoside cotransporter n=1 Tax=Elysia marginata TaxID=1093978 RepID=A0AAV4H9T4_9GAST|nr:sodium/nucleoside cotransporter [Elysia marginata]